MSSNGVAVLGAGIFAKEGVVSYVPYLKFDTTGNKHTYRLLLS